MGKDPKNKIPEENAGASEGDQEREKKGTLVIVIVTVVVFIVIFWAIYAMVMGVEDTQSPAEQVGWNNQVEAQATDFSIKVI